VSPLWQGTVALGAASLQSWKEGQNSQVERIIDKEARAFDLKFPAVSRNLVGESLPKCAAWEASARLAKSGRYIMPALLKVRHAVPLHGSNAYKKVKSQRPTPLSVLSCERTVHRHTTVVRMTSAFSNYIGFESSATVKHPSPIAIPPSTPTIYELDELGFGTKYNGPSTPPMSGAQTPKTPREMESTTPVAGAIEIAQSLTNPPRNKSRFIAACMIFTMMGLNDSATGALIPYLQRYYDVNYSIISLIFVTNALGFISAAPITNRLHRRFGRAKVLALGMSCLVVAYIILVCAPPFPLVVVSFYFSGLGMALYLALTTGFIAGMVNATVLLGIGTGMYGLGGVLGPLIATSMVAAGKPWSVFYSVMLAFSVVNLITVYWAFHGMEAETASPLLSALECQASRVSDVSQRTGRRMAESSARVTVPSKTGSKASFRGAITSRVTLLGAWFIFAYQGAEVSISGWVLSFLLTSRQYPESQTVSLGYITAGFWGGITIGRLCLSYPARRIGEKTSVFVLIAAAAGLQFVVWFVPNIMAEAVAVAIVGLLLGPISPCATVVFSRLMTGEELVPALSIVTALGSSGGAAGPLITGVVGQKVGAWVLNPTAIGLFAAMIGCWIGLPRLSKRTE